jgi:hypothetical protein
MQMGVIVGVVVMSVFKSLLWYSAIALMGQMSAIAIFLLGDGYILLHFSNVDGVFN